MYSIILVFDHLTFDLLLFLLYKNVNYLCGEESVKKMQKMVNSPLFDQVKLYSEASAVVMMKKNHVLLSKPRFVGLAILGISKEIMYNFHYSFILPNFPGSVFFIYLKKHLFYLRETFNLYTLDICINYVFVCFRC